MSALQGQRSVRIEVGGHVVEVSGPEPLAAVERTALRLLHQTSEVAARIPLGFGTAQPQTERCPEMEE